MIKLFILLVAITTCLFIGQVESSLIQCNINVNSQVDYANNLCGCAFDGSTVPPCKSLSDLNNNLLNNIKSNSIPPRGESESKTILIRFTQGVYYVNNGNNIIFGQEILTAFNSISFSSVNSYQVTFDGTGYDGSFISNIGSDTSFELVIADSFNFINWGSSSSDSPIFNILNNAEIIFNIQFCTFQQITNRQIILIQNGDSNGNDYIRNNGSMIRLESIQFVDVSTTTSLIPIEFQSVNIYIYEAKFTNCSSDSGIFLSNHVGKNLNSKEIKSTFEWITIENSKITNLNNDNKLRNTDGFISISNCYLLISRSAFHGNNGRLISFDSVQQTDDEINRNIYFDIEYSNFYLNSIGSSDDGDDSLISYLGENDNTYRSRIVTCSFSNTTEYNQESNSILLTTFAPTVEFKDCTFDSKTNTVVSSMGSKILFNNTYVMTDKPVIGSISKIWFEDSTISSDHSKYSLCRLCIFNYTSNSNSSLNWVITTDIIDLGIFSDWVKIFTVLIYTVIFCLFIVSGVILIREVIKRRKQRKQQQNTYVPLETVLINNDINDIDTDNNLNI